MSDDQAAAAPEHNYEYGREYGGYSHMGIPPGCPACAAESKASEPVPDVDPTPAAALAGWREITDAATPGPWEAHSHQRQYSIWHDELDQPLAREVRNWDDAVFISSASVAMPRLLAAVEAVLKLTVRWKNFAASGEECADELRAAIAREIGGTPQRGGGDSGA